MRASPRQAHRRTPAVGPCRMNGPAADAVTHLIAAPILLPLLALR